MNRTIGRFLILGVVGLALSLGTQSSARAQWGWGWDPGYYNYGVGYYPYSANYWPSSYYVGYGSYSLSPSNSWGAYYGGCGSCGGCSTCGGCSSCGPSWCGSCSSGGCGSCGGCGVSSCGGCGSCYGLACGPSCGCSSGCGTSTGSGCGATTPVPAKPRSAPAEPTFEPRPYDPNAPSERPRTTPAPAAGNPAAAGPSPAGPDADAGTGAGRYQRSGDGTKTAPTKSPDDEFNQPVTKPKTTQPPASTNSKDTDPGFGTNETKKVTEPIQQRVNKAPVNPPDDATQDPPLPKKAKPESKDQKTPSAQNSREPAESNAPALTLQERATWRLAGISRPLFGRIVTRPAPVPERVTSSTGDWAVFSADEAQVVRR
jgi:hypothetical protein